MQREVVCGNGLRTTYGYDSRNQLISLNAGFDGKEPLLQAAYRYDGNGNRVGKEEQLQRKLGIQREVEQTIYRYDKMNRLTGESRNGSETSYRYDLAGNRTSCIQAGNKETYHYNSRNQLTEFTSDNRNIRYSYDFAGNLVEENHSSATSSSNRIQYTYDSYNRNTEVKGNDFRQKNVYDAEGYRCRLEENEKVTDFVYRGGMLLGEMSGEDKPKKNYVLGNEYIGSVSETEKESTARYYVTDEQGSVRYVLNGDGEVEGHYQYDAFGERITQEGNQSRLQYNSQIWDEVSGLYYLRARYYNPRTGRFTQEDVIYDDGLNLYAYCNSNPVIYGDPDGFEKANAKGDLPNRKQAFNEAKDRAGIPRSQQPNRQWRVGNDINMKGHDVANYKYDPNPGSHGRYHEYDTPNGKRVIVEHTNDGVAHVHAGKPKGNPDSHSYDFKTDRYQKIDGSDGDHHICYKK